MTKNELKQLIRETLSETTNEMFGGKEDLASLTNELTNKRDELGGLFDKLIDQLTTQGDSELGLKVKTVRDIVDKALFSVNNSLENKYGNR